MKQAIVSIAKYLGIYHPLQLGYRRMRAALWKATMRYRYKRYRGEGVRCNVCGTMHTRYIPWHPSTVDAIALDKHSVVAGYGDNVFCPACFSTARERLVVFKLGEWAGETGLRILHFSPEKNIHSVLKKLGDVVTADLHPGYYTDVDRNIQREDLGKLSYASGIFDLVVGNHIMEHIKDDRSAMREIHRVMKPGGRAILQVPVGVDLASTIEDMGETTEQERRIRFGQRDHVRIYTVEDYVERLRSVGFLVDAEEEGEGTVREFGFQPGEIFFRIRKPGGEE